MDDTNAATSGGTDAESKAPESEARIVEETVIKPSPQSAPVAPVEKKEAALPPLPHNITPPSPVNAAPPAPPVESLPIAPLTSAPLSPPLTPATPPPSHTADELTKEQEVIAKILKDAKLPERNLETTSQKSPRVFDTTLGGESQTPIMAPPAPTPIAASEVPPENEKTESFASAIVSPLRTLKDDLQNTIRQKKMSLVRAVALEQEKRRHPSEEEHEREEVSAGRSRRTTRILFAAGLLVTLGVLAFFGVFLVMGERSGIAIGSPKSDILFAENGVPLALEGNALELKRLIANARLSGSGTLGSITRIIPTVQEANSTNTSGERGATLEEFLRALGTRVPDELLRALSKDFFFGLHTVDENAPLFVIPVISYERAFAGMLAWEETLSADLSPAFTPVPDQVIGSGGLPEKRHFEDIVMRNYDVRALKDDAGIIQLYYSFPTRSLLVIAESPYSFTEILSRLRAERKL